MAVDWEAFVSRLLARIEVLEKHLFGEAYAKAQTAAHSADVYAPPPVPTSVTVTVPEAIPAPPPVVPTETTPPATEPPAATELIPPPPPAT